MAREAEAEAPRWEDGIDVDDSDLLLRLLPLSSPSSFSSSSQNLTLSSQFPPLRPCSHFQPLPSESPSPPTPPPPPPSLFRPTGKPLPCSSCLIPGPAGSVQAAMRRHSAALRDSACHGELGEDAVGPDPDGEDGDFKLNPWLCALEFLGKDLDLVWPIGSIKTRDAERVPQVVGIVKSCTPNGLGNLFLTLKDPSGSIGASIHHGVLADCNLGCDISVGCVLILKQVVAFCPARTTRYLNVTSKNVVKLVNKDCGSPHKKTLPLSKAGGKNVESGYGTKEGEPSLWNVAKSLVEESGKQDRGVGGVLSDPHATVCTKRVASWSVLEHMDTEHQLAAGERATKLKISAQEEAQSNLNCQRKTVGADRCTRSALCRTSSVNPTALVSSELDDSFASNVEAAAPLAVHRASADNEERSSNSARIVGGRKTDISSGFPCDGLVKTSTTMMPARSDLGVDETKKLISGLSVAQWTDEQLLELFSDYQDDADLVGPRL